MKSNKVLALCGLLALLPVLTLVPAEIKAAEYPDRTITLLVPYAPGAVFFEETRAFEK